MLRTLLLRAVQVSDIKWIKVINPAFKEVLDLSLKGRKRPADDRMQSFSLKEDKGEQNEKRLIVQIDD